MEQKEKWREEFEKIANTCRLRERTLIEEFNERKFVKDFIEKTLSSQAHALKEQMKPVIEKEINEFFGEATNQQILKSIALSSQILSAIESIEI